MKTVDCNVNLQIGRYHKPRFYSRVFTIYTEYSTLDSNETNLASKKGLLAVKEMLEPQKEQRRGDLSSNTEIDRKAYYVQLRRQNVD